MTYEVGQKVETLLGVGKIVGYHELYDIYLVDLNDEFTNQQFKEYHLKPYKSAHDKLIEMGYECYETIYSGKLYLRTEADETLPVEINISRHSKYYYIPDNDCVNLELSRVLTQYLEEVE